MKLSDVTHRELLANDFANWLNRERFTASPGTSLMIAPQTAFADIRDGLRSAVEDNPALAEALEDYQEACRRLDDKRLEPTHRAEWEAIRDELDIEIRRLFQMTTV